MVNARCTSLWGVLILFGGGAAGQANAEFILRSGSIIAQSTTVVPEQFSIIEYSSGGAIMQTLSINSVPAGFGLMNGLTVIGNRVLVCGSNGIVAEVNLATGALFNSFDIHQRMGIQAFGSIGSDLLIGIDGEGVIPRIMRYSTQGALLDVTWLPITPHLGGIDSDGSQFFVGSGDNGNIYRLDLSGHLLGTIETGLGVLSLSGVSYDPASGNLWVSTAWNHDEIRQYSQSGVLVSSFPAQFTFVGGLDIVPEPGALMLACAASVAARRRRCAGSRFPW